MTSLRDIWAWLGRDGQYNNAAVLVLAVAGLLNLFTVLLGWAGWIIATLAAAAWIYTFAFQDPDKQGGDDDA